MLNKEKKGTSVLKCCSKYDSLQIREVGQTRQFWTGDIKGLGVGYRLCAQDVVQYGGINSHDFFFFFWNITYNILLWTLFPGPYRIRPCRRYTTVAGQR